MDFSFEILPPLKGNSIYKVFSVVDRLRQFNPKQINITSHHSEYIYREQPDGLLRRVSTLKRPGTVAVAAAIQNRYGIQAVPHIICRGFSKEETEYALLDLNFLGITNLFLIRGDSKGVITPTDQSQIYNDHATDLQQQVNLFNRGIGLDDMRIEGIETPFTYGMACYPEKHEEAPNLASDLRYAKQKVDAGASYLVTQMFFDNQKYFDFVEQARSIGINVPIIPGIKPLGRLSQLNVIPKVFHCDLPEALTNELEKCTTDEQVRQIGIEWAIAQCRELRDAGVPGIHFYTYMASESVEKVAREIY